MINQDKWVNSLPIKNIKLDDKTYQADHEKWANTVSKKNSFNAVKKYSLMTILLVGGLLFVSAVKNETRNLEKEINNLIASNNTIKFNLNQAILDNEVITSPENISQLAKEYLDKDLVSYERSQIKQLNDKNSDLSKVDKLETKKSDKDKIKKLQTNLKSQIVKKIEAKQTEIKKLQELYSNPQSVPGEIKNQVAIKIEKKKVELKNIYEKPKDIFTLERIGRWSVVQVVKVFLGMPVVPGR